MLFLHEVHRVRGAREEEFEAAYRDGWMPTLAEGDDARLLYFMHHAHGTGFAYSVVTVTAVRDGAAWERLAESLRTGPLHDWVRALDQLRHGVEAKTLVPVPWSPLQEIDLSAVPTERRARADAVHGGHRLAPRGDARRLPRGRPHALRAQPRGGAPRPRPARAPGRAATRVGQRSLARGGPLAEGRATRGWSQGS